MKAVFTDARNDDDKIRCFTEIFDDVPKPDKNEIVVEVKACALNNSNYKAQCDVLFKKSPNKYLLGEDIAGIVSSTGEEVSHVAVGDAVVGIVPLNAKFPGCAEYCVLSEYDVVKKPDGITFEEAAASIGDCVKAYTALHYHGRACSGDTVLIVDAATHFGSIATQIAQLWGTKVIATATSQAEKSYLQGFQPPVGQIIELSHRSGVLVSGVMEETGGCGVDCVIDNGVRLFTYEEDKVLMKEQYKYPVLHKHDIISCLGFGGQWITSHPELQLDPPDSQQLYLRGGSVSFLFHQSWILCKAQQGRYQHILSDAVDKLNKGLIRCKISKTISIDDVCEAMKTIEDVRIGKVVVRMDSIS